MTDRTVNRMKRIIETEKIVSLFFFIHFRRLPLGQVDSFFFSFLFPSRSIRRRRRPRILIPRLQYLH